MWIEIIEIKDMEKVALLKNQFGCSINFTAEIIKNNLVRKTDCHYYYYSSDKIELLTGYKEIDDIINSIAYVIKADIKNYQEATRLMAEHLKEYLKKRKIKKWVVYYGSEDEEQMNSANIGIGKIGYSELIKIGKPEYEKLGFRFIFGRKKLVVEMI